MELEKDRVNSKNYIMFQICSSSTDRMNIWYPSVFADADIDIRQWFQMGMQICHYSRMEVSIDWPTYSFNHSCNFTITKTSTMIDICDVLSYQINSVINFMMYFIIYYMMPSCKLFDLNIDLLYYGLLTIFPLFYRIFKIRFTFM